MLFIFMVRSDLDIIKFIMVFDKDSNKDIIKLDE